MHITSKLGLVIGIFLIGVIICSPVSAYTPQADEFNAANDYNELGIVYIEHGRYDDAVTAYNKAIQIYPDFAIAWYNRGNALKQLGRWDDALASYDRANKINSTFYESWYNRGTLLLTLERYEEALSSFEQAFKINHQLSEAYSNHGFVLFKLGRYEEAIASYDKALTINPRIAESWNNRGNALVLLGRYGEAIESYDNAININPNYERARESRDLAIKLRNPITSPPTTQEPRYSPPQQNQQQVTKAITLPPMEPRSTAKASIIYEPFMAIGVMIALAIWRR
jgi:tetratricopeptide (TPR) repeat protein